MTARASFCGLLVGLGVVALVPRPARACGGFFCSGSVPVDQSGENIVFAVEPGGMLETHVQIFYSGAAPEFAWVLPVPSVPELDIGTNALFTALDRATAPQFPMTDVTEGTCRPQPACNYPRSCPGNYDASASARDSASPPPPGTPPPPGVMVHVQENVGAFEAVVLSVTDPGAMGAVVLHEWLETHGYDLPESSIPVLQEYVDLGDYFVALRLQSDRMTGEIQPIVLRYLEDEPCIPIRLTAISTIPDLPINAYVLASSLAAPRNYSFVEPPEDSALWTGGGDYARLVSRAVDEAGGRAFVTDYAGDSPSITIALPPLDGLRDAESPEALVRGLFNLGYQGDAQLLAVLQRVIPPPEGTDPQSYYNCLATSVGCGGETPADWDPAAAVDAIDEAIVAPRLRAEALVRRHARTTRLFTTMSADEMTLDPVFRLDEGMAEVDNIRTATRVTECAPDYFAYEAPQRLELPSGREVPIRLGRIDSRSDEEVCQSSGGTLGTPRQPSCVGDGPTGGASGASGGGGCSAGSTPTRRGPSTSGWLGGLVVVLGIGGFSVLRRRRARQTR